MIDDKLIKKAARAIRLADIDSRYETDTVYRPMARAALEVFLASTESIEGQGLIEKGGRP